jgi:hypothetical protein
VLEYPQADRTRLEGTLSNIAKFFERFIPDPETLRRLEELLSSGYTLEPDAEGDLTILGPGGEYLGYVHLTDYCEVNLLLERGR